MDTGARKEENKANKIWFLQTTLVNILNSVPTDHQKQTQGWYEGGQDDLNPCLRGWLVRAEEGNTAGGTHKTRPDIDQVMPERPD